MLSRRALIFLTLPGFALVWGFFMIKRRKIETSEEEKTKETKQLAKSNYHTASVKITKQKAESPETKFGKSAPINIQSNGKIGHKACFDEKPELDNFFEESLNSLLSNIPDSVSNKQIFKTKKFNSDNAIVVKASSENMRKTLEGFEIPESFSFEKKMETECALRESSKEDKGIHLYTNVSTPDSGKGSSLPNSENLKVNYEFLLPTSLIGQLYGRKRIHINQIKSQTGAKITIKNHPVSKKLNICVISGSENDVNSALSLIRSRLPAKLYPNLTLQRIHQISQETVVPLSPEHSQSMQINLIEGINNDVVISYVLNGGHIFVQQPLHPSHPSLAVMQNYLNNMYNNFEAPMLPEINDHYNNFETPICVGKVDNDWYRLQIIEHQENNNLLVKFLDFGGYALLNISNLRQIRSDFMSMPFQATECILSNIQPINEEWCDEATSVMLDLTRGRVLQAQIAGYNNQNVPEIYLFSNLGANNIVFINKELVARNLAKWVES